MPKPPKLSREEKLVQAVRKGDLKEVQKLIKKGANVNYEDVAMQRQTCLHQAATWNHTAVLQTLVEAKAKIDARDEIGSTPLLVAAFNGSEGCVGTLLAAGANMESKNRKGETALMQAAINGKAVVAALLCQRGANVNAATKEGWTALHKASNQLGVAELLVLRGADPMAKGPGNISCLDFASDRVRDAIKKAGVTQRRRSSINMDADPLHTTSNTASSTASPVASPMPPSEGAPRAAEASASQTAPRRASNPFAAPERDDSVARVASL